MWYRSAHLKTARLLAASLELAGLVIGGSAFATVICVNPGGTHGCIATIQGAIDSVSSTGATGTTIVVQPGTYIASCTAAACSVASILASATNGASLTGLTLKCRAQTGRPIVLDASHLDHGIYVSGLSHVTIQGCVVKNADREWILIENSNNAMVANNEVKKSDQAMGKTFGHRRAAALPHFPFPRDWRRNHVLPRRVCPWGPEIFRVTTIPAWTWLRICPEEFKVRISLFRAPLACAPEVPLGSNEATLGHN